MHSKRKGPEVSDALKVGIGPWQKQQNEKSPNHMCHEKADGN